MSHLHGDQPQSDQNAQDRPVGCPPRVCVLWHTPNSGGGEGASQGKSARLDRVIEAMTKRGFGVTCVQSQHAAFGSACRCAKDAKRVVLVLDEPETLVGVDRVLDGLERFAPSVICWEHESNANPPMRPVVRMTEEKSSVKQDRISDDSLDQNQGLASPEKPVELRLVSDQPNQENPVSRPQPVSGPLRASDVLNADELDALLAGEMSE